MTSTSRKTVRDALATLLNAGLTGAGNPVQEVYGYLASDFEGQSPVVIVQSASIQRDVATRTDVWDNLMRFNVLVWVMDADTASGWSDEDVDDKIDQIEAAIADIVVDNAKNTTWERLTYDAEPTRIVRVTVGSTPYVVEQIPLIVTVLD